MEWVTAGLLLAAIGGLMVTVMLKEAKAKREWRGRWRGE